MVRAVIRFACIACLAGTMSVNSNHDDRSSPSVQIQIIKGAQYQFREPAQLAGAGGNDWTFNLSYVNTLVRASNGALVRTLTTNQGNWADQTGYGVSGNDVWVESGNSRIDLKELSGSTGTVIRTLALAKSASYSSGLLAVAGDDIWLAFPGGTTSQEPAATREVSLSTGHVLRSLPAPGAVEPACIVATTSTVWLDHGSRLYSYSATTGRQLGSVALAFSPYYPFDMVLVGQNLWVPDGSRVYVIDGYTMHVVKVLSSTSDGFNGTQGVATNGHLVWALNTRAPSVSVFNSSSRSFEGVLKGARFGFLHPSAILWYDGRVWVANNGNGTNLGSLTAFA